MDAYLHRGEIVCHDCAEAAHDDGRRLDHSEYVGEPFPNGGGEGDMPRHCARCRSFLENPLTEIGWARLLDAIGRGRGEDEVLAVYREFYLEDYEPTRYYNNRGVATHAL